MTDDAAGVEALAAFSSAYRVPEGVDLVDGGTLGLDLLHIVEGYPRVLILDCVVTGREPGTVMRIEGEDIPRVLGQCLSPHQMGIQDLAAALELLGRMPERLVVLGIEPESVAPGVELSEPVRRSLPRLVDAAAEVLREWGVEVRRLGS
ncbi:MAG: hydrogenase maturation protease [Candidatus Dadabacteria bacterium]|nr:MAG: hydrogenase maturation protease [Candidatus Dadabacteria bacterium]